MPSDVVPDDPDSARTSVRSASFARAFAPVSASARHAANSRPRTVISFAARPRVVRTADRQG